MIEIDTKGGLGDIGVATTEYKGHSPEFWAERCTLRICGISETQHLIYDNKLKHID